jgi:hypothetical protein
MAAFVLALALLASCGGDGTLPADVTEASSDAPAQAAEYGSVTELKNAAVEAGYVCSTWEVDNVVALAAESGSCGDDSVLSTYASQEDLQSQLDIEKEASTLLTDNGIETTPTLVGPNWLFKAPEAVELRESIGGVLIGSKE